MIDTPIVRLTLQQVFDNALRGVRAQGALSRDEWRSCRYRMEEGGKQLRCGIGYSIPDELYNPDFEGKTVQTLFDWSPSIESLLPLERHIVVAIQHAHDDSYDLTHFEIAMHDVADKHGLTWTPADAAPAIT